MENQNDKQLRMDRILSAPIKTVWTAFTEPERVAQWWGPNDFTAKIHEMNVMEGGEWKLTLHGPNGTTYLNRSIYKEVERHRKIAFEHFNPHFFTTIFMEKHGAGTQLCWIMEFDTVEMRDIVVKAHKADEGLKENMEKLENYLSHAV